MRAMSIKPSAILSAFAFTSCVSPGNTGSTQTQPQEIGVPSSCAVPGTPCEIELTPSSTPGIVTAQYHLCCASGFSGSVLEVSGHEGNWGDVTRWVLCGHTYTEEFTHPNNSGAGPWAILSVFDGMGGEITDCRTPNAPVF
jgi:hypothetical protein